jgi:hypothetical protein
MPRKSATNATLGYIPEPVPGEVKLAELMPDGLLDEDDKAPELLVLALRDG